MQDSAPADDVNIKLLTPAVRRLLCQPSARLTAWKSVPISYAAVVPATAGIYAVSGFADTDSASELPWSMILKVIRPPVPSDAPTSASSVHPALITPSNWRYWKREPLAYQSPILTQLNGALRAPHCYGIQPWANGDIWIWLEHGEESGIGNLSDVEKLVVFARHIAQFNAAFLAEKVQPKFPWLARGRVMTYISADISRDAAQHLTQWRHPLVVKQAPASLSNRVAHLFSNTEALVRIVRALPLTLCHGDAHPANLFAKRHIDGRMETIAIDWAALGIEHLGSDLGPLIGGSIHRFAIPIERAAEFETAMVDAYMQALIELGLTDLADQVRYAWIPAAMIYAVAAARFLTYAEQLKASEIALRNRSFEELVSHRVAFLSFLVGRMESALDAQRS